MNQSRTELLLRDAIAHEKLENVQNLIHCGNINAADENGVTLLMEAVYHSKSPQGRKIFHLILNHPDLNINQKENNGLTALSIAVKINWDIVPALLKKGANPNVYTVAKIPGKSEPFYHSATPWRQISLLSFAIWKANYKIAVLLLKYGADVNMISSLDITPLSMAARINDDKMLDYLIKKANARLDVIPTNWRDFTSNPQKACPVALRKALKHGSDKCVEKLLKAGCSLPSVIYRANQTFATPLTYVLQQIPTLYQNYMHSSLLPSVLPKNDYMQTFRVLLKETAYDAQMQDSEGRTPLSYIAEKGLISFCEAALTPQTVNLPDKKGLTPLGYALLNNQRPVIHYLLDHGANPNCLVPDITLYKKIIQNNELVFIPAIQFAVKTQKTDVVQKMFEKGVNLLCYPTANQLIYNSVRAHQPITLTKKLLAGWHYQKKIFSVPQQSDLLRGKIKERIHHQRES